MKLRLLILMLIIFIGFSCCVEEEKEPPKSTPVSLILPDHFPPITFPNSNPLTKEKIELGRHLYYDQFLSEGGPLQGNSCSSCHHQTSSFSSINSVAVLAHVNMAWNTSFLWNGAVEGSLEEVMVFELADFFQVDLNYLKSSNKYKELFRTAFPTEEISIEKAAMAMASFSRTLLSSNSKFDQYLVGNVNLSASEQRGYEIFNSERGDCFHCHSSPLMTDLSFHNIGLETKFANHLGRFEVTGNTADVGSFKTPTLRNIALTAPYMHDDRFKTLEEVIDHYDQGVLPSPVLDPIMTKPGKETGLHLSNDEKMDLITFLLTLTDSTFISNPDLSNPW